MTGFEGVGDFDSDDPWERYAAHQAAKGRWPSGGGGPTPSFTCPKCGMTSYHPEDVRQGYCGSCHEFTGEQEAPA